MTGATVRMLFVTACVCATFAPRAFSATVADFYGVWTAEPDCASARQQTEGRYFVLRENFFEPGWGSICKETKTWLEKGKMRISASCEGEEAGSEILAMELEYVAKDRLKGEDEDYKRCAK